MTIACVRFCYQPRRRRLEHYLHWTHGGFNEWFTRRLEPIQEQLRGPEVKGVDIVNFVLHEVPKHAWRPDEWHRRFNTFEFSFVCDLSPLRNHPPIENIEKLMAFAAAMAAQAPWPQVRAVATALARPLNEEDRASLLPYLTWPRESTLRRVGYTGEQLEALMAKLRRQAAIYDREARYR